MNPGENLRQVWNMGNLGLQALQSVAGAEDPLLRLEELSQNFPSRATALSALKLQPEARDEAQVCVCVCVYHKWRTKKDKKSIVPIV